MNILLLLALPTLYILLASVSLLQFAALFSALEALSVHASTVAALQPVAPGEATVGFSGSDALGGPKQEPLRERERWTLSLSGDTRHARSRRAADTPLRPSLSSLSLLPHDPPSLPPIPPQQTLVLRSFVHYLEACFGPAHKFAPNGTQVLLAAVIVAVVAHGGRR